MRLRFRSLVLAVLALVLSGTQAFAAFTYYKAVTYDHLQAGTADSTNYPLLVLRSADTNLNTHARSDGHDIRPYLNSDCSTGVITAFELVYYSAGTLEMWVSISTLSHTADGTFYLCYGDNAVTGDGSSNTTWPASAKAAYHLRDGSSLTLTDATSNANTLTGVNTPTATTGQIDGGVALARASTQYLTTGSDVATVALSFEAWVKATSFSGAYNSVLNRIGGVFQSYFQLFTKSNGKLAVYVFGSADISYDGTGATTLSTGTWYHLVATYDATAGLIGYVNGVSDGTVAANGNLNTTTATNVRVGSDIGTSGREWDGVIDEARIWDIALSSSWITADYNSQKPSQSMVTYGSETALGGGATTSPTLPLLGAGPG